MNYELARIILPTPEWKDQAELFMRSGSEREIYINKHHTKAKLYEFNTWMNMFAAKKYYKYCDLGELYLKLNIKGSYHLQVIGSNYNYLYNYLDTILVDTYVTSNKIEIAIPNANNYEGIFFVVLEDKDKPIEIISAAWTTDKSPVRANRFAIVTCTYKREDFINKTISVYEQFIGSNPKLKERIKLFVVDNGKTLDIKRNNDTTKIYHNKNAGGSGGFTRGLMEVCCLNEKAEENDPYTRVLFMDDDVEVIPESIHRTMILTDYLREEWKDSFINGAMLNLEEKNLFFENLAFQKNLYVCGDNQNTDLCNYERILLINRRPDNIFNNINVKVDSAWWFCSFCIGKETKNNLPLPFFVWADDVEWSWRNFGKHHISFNGIFVWHPNFIWRTSVLRDLFFLPRNMFMVNAIYTNNFKEKFEKYYCDIFIYRLRVYDYIGIEILLAAMDSILKGSLAFREDPEAQLQKITQIANKIIYFDAAKEELKQAESYFPGAGPRRKVASKLTLWGVFFPDFLFTKESIALEWFPSIDNFRLRKNVKVYNLLTSKYCIRAFDRKKILFYRREFKKRLAKIKRNFDVLRKDYSNSFSEFTSFGFWEKYLGIG